MVDCSIFVKKVCHVFSATGEKKTNVSIIKKIQKKRLQKFRFSFLVILVVYLKNSLSKKKVNRQKKHNFTTDEVPFRKLCNKQIAFFFKFQIS